MQKEKRKTGLRMRFAVKEEMSSSTEVFLGPSESREDEPKSRIKTRQENEESRVKSTKERKL